MGKNKVVNVIRHLAFEDLASFTAVLSENDTVINYIEAGYDDLAMVDATSDDLLVILGGPISVNDVEMFPFLETEIAMLKQRIAVDKPTLGICLGAQLMAKALGQSVYAGKAKEIGWYDIHLTDAGEQSALQYIGGQHCSMLHWHGETFDLPEGAVRLASSDICENQAFSYGENSLALQFHPEITQRSIEKWFIGHIGEIMQTAGVSVETIREDTQRYAGPLERQAEKFLRAWVSEVMG